MRSNKLMFDRRTNTLWNQLTGEPVIGELAHSGQRLKVLPVVTTTWGDWLEAHPDTDVVALDTGHDREYILGASYGEYFLSPETMFPAAPKPGAESGGPPRERLFVVRTDKAAKAIPLASLRKERVQNLVVGELPIVVIAPEKEAPMPIPKNWQAGLAAQKLDPAPTLIGELSEASLGALFETQANLLKEVSVEQLLQFEPNARRVLISGWVAAGKLSRSLRDQVALRGRAVEVRAFQRGSHQFEALKQGEEEFLRDEKGVSWRIDEKAIISEDGESLERVGGHLLDRFGWESYFASGN